MKINEIHLTTMALLLVVVDLVGQYYTPFILLPVILAAGLGHSFCSVASLSFSDKLFTSACGRSLAAPEKPQNNFVASRARVASSLLLFSVHNASSSLSLSIVHSSGLYAFFSCTSNHSATNPSLLLSFEFGFFSGSRVRVIFNSIVHL